VHRKGTTETERAPARATRRPGVAQSPISIIEETGSPWFHPLRKLGEIGVAGRRVAEPKKRLSYTGKGVCLCALEEGSGQPHRPAGESLQPKEADEKVSLDGRKDKTEGKGPHR